MRTTEQIKPADKTLILATIKRMIRSLDHAALHIKNDDVNSSLNAMRGMRTDAGSITVLLEMIRATRIAEATANYGEVE